MRRSPGELSPLIRKLFVLLPDGGTTVGEALAFVRARAKFVEKPAIFDETQITAGKS